MTSFGRLPNADVSFDCVALKNCDFIVRLPKTFVLFSVMSQIVVWYSEQELPFSSGHGQVRGGPTTIERARDDR
jgi:hypothetical protein